MRSVRGFTLAETLVALAVSAVALRMVSRPASTYLARSRSARAASTLAGDIDLARSTAVRLRQPVRLAWDASTSTYTISARNAGTSYKRVSLGAASDYKLPAVSFSAATVDFYPGGTASSSLSVSLGSGTATRTVTVSRVGLVRVR